MRHCKPPEKLPSQRNVPYSKGGRGVRGGQRVGKLPAKGEGKITHKSVYLRADQWQRIVQATAAERGYTEAEVIRYIVDLGLAAYFGEPNLDKK